ncbi:Delta(3,5)-Delta(2,4)-dienoyl-CoA isomerase, peroxisomal like [Actinidia chinensis var. chinensis]|uniref:Delta(3,5)-Delta(2,4)-dienoyl-CoA isomerase, peroxisomal like n=1 Tax=Actinidia chinensis var. chinensis TaxID=1590841 RepID=A0A2R6QRI9_ACTCC|nr:Delta(3,5)-Delta(2,4)-dienoyl-CoA isomerase, peroxisomal like [Actinidia chinensis var. chinensis]
MDIITDCDLRYCTEDAFFSVKEVDLAITAYLGTLQRLPTIVGYGNAMELTLNGRTVSGSEAKSLGLVSKVFSSKDTMGERVRAVADRNFVFSTHSIFVYFSASQCWCFMFDEKNSYS